MTNSTAATNQVLNIGIIGCGLIGQKRAAALGAGGKLVACADTRLARAETLAKKVNAEAYDTWQALIERKDIDAVVIATLHDSLAEITLALLILPPVPDDIRLLTVVLPVTFNVPAMLAPVPVTTIILALPALLSVILPFATTDTLLLPFTIELPALTVIPVSKLPLPVKKLAVTKLPRLALPAVTLPVTAKLVSVPVLVILGCAFVYTVPDIKLLATCPDTLPPATALAVVAYVARLAVP